MLGANTMHFLRPDGSDILTGRPGATANLLRPIQYAPPFHLYCALFNRWSLAQRAQASWIALHIAGALVRHYRAC